MPDIDTESIYLDLYDEFADASEYLQSDSEVRLALPPELIVGAVSWALSAFATGFFNHLGGQTADSVLTRIRRRSAEVSSEQVIEALEVLAPYLPLLEKSTEEERRAEEQWVSAELERHGFTLLAAQQLAKKVVDRLRQAEEPS